MTQLIFVFILAFSVSYGQNWNWNRNGNKPCRYLDRINCDAGYYSPDKYYRRDGDRDGDWNHRHGHDNDNNWNNNKQICGSDGVTYKNRCYFRKAHCKHNNIVMRHVGPCTTVKTDAPQQRTPKPQPTTPKRQPTTLKPQQTTPKVPVTDEFCQNLFSMRCHGGSPICGTNDQSYDNECELEKAKCLDGNVHVKHLGTC